MERESYIIKDSMNDNSVETTSSRPDLRLKKPAALITITKNVISAEFNPEERLTENEFDQTKALVDTLSDVDAKDQNAQRDVESVDEVDLLQMAGALVSASKILDKTASILRDNRTSKSIDPEENAETRDEARRLASEFASYSGALVREVKHRRKNDQGEAYELPAYAKVASVAAGGIATVTGGAEQAIDQPYVRTAEQVFSKEFAKQIQEDQFQEVDRPVNLAKLTEAVNLGKRLVHATPSPDASKSVERKAQTIGALSTPYEGLSEAALKPDYKKLTEVDSAVINAHLERMGLEEFKAVEGGKVLWTKAPEAQKGVTPLSIPFFEVTGKIRFPDGEKEVKFMGLMGLPSINGEEAKINYRNGLWSMKVGSKTMVVGSFINSPEEGEEIMAGFLDPTSEPKNKAAYANAYGATSSAYPLGYFQYERRTERYPLSYYTDPKLAGKVGMAFQADSVAKDGFIIRFPIRPQEDTPDNNDQLAKIVGTKAPEGQTPNPERPFSIDNYEFQNGDEIKFSPDNKKMYINGNEVPVTRLKLFGRIEPYGINEYQADAPYNDITIIRYEAVFLSSKIESRNLLKPDGSVVSVEMSVAYFVLPPEPGDDLDPMIIEASIPSELSMGTSNGGDTHETSVKEVFGSLESQKPGTNMRLQFTSLYSNKLLDSFPSKEVQEKKELYRLINSKVNLQDPIDVTQIYKDQRYHPRQAIKMGGLRVVTVAPTLSKYP